MNFEFSWLVLVTSSVFPSFDGSLAPLMIRGSALENQRHFAALYLSRRAMEYQLWLDPTSMAFYLPRSIDCVTYKSRSPDAHWLLSTINKLSGGAIFLHTLLPFSSPRRKWKHIWRRSYQLRDVHLVFWSQALLKIRVLTTIIRLIESTSDNNSLMSRMHRIIIHVVIVLETWSWNFWYMSNSSHGSILDFPLHLDLAMLYNSFYLGSWDRL